MKGKRPSGEERGELELLRRRVKQLEAEVSKLEQTEKELARCQDRYRILMEESPIPLWGLDFSQTKQLVDRLWAAGVRDFERRFREHPDDFATLVDGVKARDVNTATLKLYGAETEEELFSVLRRSFKQTPDRADTFAKGVAFLAAGRTSFETEAPVETLKGEEKHLAIRWSVASGCEQTWSRVFISMIDVTERKRAEQGLRESEERCRRLFDTCPDGIVITTREGEFLSANRAYLDMLGRTMEELKQMRSWQFTPAKWAKSEAKAVASLLKAGRGVRVKEYVRKDGTVFPVSLTGWVMKDQENVPLEVGAFVKDITERRRAESELRIKDSAIETSINGIALADLAGTLTYVNPAFLKMWGYDDPGEVVGRPAVSFW